jgi:2-hydroxychromene-2-carboxylate isomerase
MAKQIEFYFDVGSPYSYLAYHQLPKIARAHNAQIVWRPILLGGIFHATATSTPASVPLKDAHLDVDLQRWARHFDIPFTPNPDFPINTLHLMRGAIAMQMRGAAEFQRYLAAVFGAMFEQPRNLNDPEQVATVLTAAGIDAPALLAQTQDGQVKAKLKADTEQAVARGVFGAPTFFVGADMFWGQDRLHFVEQALG